MKRNFERLLVTVLLLMSFSLAACAPAATQAPAPAPQETTAPAAQVTTAPAAPATQAPAVVATEAPAMTEAPVATEAPAVEPSTLVIAMNIDGVITLDPGYMFEIEPQVIMGQTYDYLVETLPADLNKFEPRLADSWDVSDDGLIWTFHLHPGVKFASGNPLTAEDVRFSWMRLINIKGSGSYYLAMVDKIEVVDDLTLKVTLKYPSPEFLSAVGTTLCGVVDSKVAKEHGASDAADADTTDKAKDFIDQQSIGSGAYIQTSWVPKSEIVMEANPNYFRGAPKIDKIIIKNATDPTTALQMLQKGEVDIVYMLDRDLVDQAKADPNIVIVPGQMYNMEYIAMTSNPELSKPLSNKTVRQAVLKAIDYDGIIQGVLNGYAITNAGVIPSGVMGVDPNAMPVRDVEGAKALLAEAGYPDGFDAELAYGTSAERDLVAAKLQADLAEVGINVTLKPLELSVYFTEARAQHLSFLIGPFATDRMDPSNWTTYMSYPDSGVSMRMFYNNPESVRLADLIAKEMDPNKRAQEVTDLEKVWAGDAWAKMLYQQQQIVAMSNKVQGFEFHPFIFTIMRNLSLSQ
jgi:peptide/nickel transport system substrate-binding protein